MSTEVNPREVFLLPVELYDYPGFKVTEKGVEMFGMSKPLVEIKSPIVRVGASSVNGLVSRLRREETTPNVIISIALQTFNSIPLMVASLMQTRIGLASSGHLILYTESLPTLELSQSEVRNWATRIFGKPEMVVSTVRSDQEGVETRGCVEVYRKY